MSKNNKIRVDFSNGQAAQHVTGSCIYLPDYQILLECGLSQSNSVERDFKENNENFNFSCKKLEYIFIGHCHLDHIGRIPLLYKRGCKAKIIAPRGSYKIMQNMFEDSVKILEHDAILLSKQKGHNYEPLYTQADIDEALKYVREYPQKELIELNDKLSFRFVPSGHIKYAAQIELFITHNNVRKKLGYTSDLGNYILPKRFTESFEPIEKCDILIGEATYSSTTKTAATPSLRERDLQKIKSVIQTCCIDNQAKLLIPCFALDRTPEMFMVIRSILRENN